MPRLRDATSLTWPEVDHGHVRVQDFLGVLEKTILSSLATTLPKKQPQGMGTTVRGAQPRVQRHAQEGGGSGLPESLEQGGQSYVSEERRAEVLQGP